MIIKFKFFYYLKPFQVRPTLSAHKIKIPIWVFFKIMFSTARKLLTAC